MCRSSWLHDPLSGVLPFLQERMHLINEVKEKGLVKEYQAINILDKWGDKSSSDLASKDQEDESSYVADGLNIELKVAYPAVSVQF